jgi:hypothetical protein
MTMSHVDSVGRTSTGRDVGRDLSTITAFAYQVLLCCRAVVGEGDDEFGKRRPYSWTRDTGVRRLETDELFHPCGVDPSGIIIGNVWTGGSCPWIRPFVYTPAHELIPLPYADDHHTMVAEINRVGTIVGNARRSGSWKHVHPVIWRLLM